MKTVIIIIYREAYVDYLPSHSSQLGGVGLIGAVDHHLAVVKVF